MDWSYLFASTIYKLLSQEVKDAFQKYNAEAIQKFKSTIYLHEINFLHDLHENTQENFTTSIKMINPQISKNLILIKI